MQFVNMQVLRSPMNWLFIAVIMVMVSALSGFFKQQKQD